MARVRDRAVVIGTRIRRGFILCGHDAIDEEETGDELKDEDSCPSIKIGIFNVAIVLE